MNRYDLVLLGLILEHERSGYDIITEIRERELDRWANLSTSTVYNRLTTLEKNECIVGRSERDGNRPERMVFNITDKGRDVLRKEVLKHLTGFNDDPRTLGFAFLFGAENKELIRFYITDDQNHIPVRLDMFLSFGSAKAFLRAYKGVKSPMTSKIN